MSDLRTIPFARDYWHVVSDKHASIIGNLMFTPEATHFPWRAEFNGTLADGWRHLKVEHFSTEELAMRFLSEMLEDEDALDGAT